MFGLHSIRMRTNHFILFQTDAKEARKIQFHFKMQASVHVQRWSVCACVYMRMKEEPKGVKMRNNHKAKCHVWKK